MKQLRKSHTRPCIPENKTFVATETQSSLKSIEILIQIVTLPTQIEQIRTGDQHLNVLQNPMSEILLIDMEYQQNVQFVKA